MKLKKLLGNKSFYKNLLIVSIPIILSQIIGQFVNILDNLMVGQLSSEEFNAVSIANQFLFIFNLTIFGIMAGPSIFATQYHGAKNIDGVKECIRYKWLLSIVILIIGLIIFITCDDLLFNLFIHNEELNDCNPIDVINFGKDYLYIMLIGLIPFIIGEIYSSNLREDKETLIPMIANIIAVGINLVLNYLLIFGKFVFPTLGVKGAAIATVIARIISCLIVMFFAIINKKYRYNNCIFKKFFPKFTTVKLIFKNSYLLLFNEVLWSTGMMLINYCYSLRGLDVVAATNIVSTFTNLFGFFGTSVGSAVAIILGQTLGANKLQEAKEDSVKYLAFSVILGVFVAILMYILKDTIPSLYKMDSSIIDTASLLIAISAIVIPIRVYSITCYFIIRSGGKVLITFLFDSVFTICIRFLVTFFVVYFTNASIYIVYMISELLEIIKIFVGTILVKKGIWIENITKKED